MSASSIDTCSHSHNNDPTKQKTCSTIVSNSIYRCTENTHIQKKNHLYIYPSIHESTSHIY